MTLYAGLSQVVRITVPSHLVPWSVPWSDYKPSDFTSPSAVGRPWSDHWPMPADCRWNEDSSCSGGVNRRSYCGVYQLAEYCDNDCANTRGMRPLNPRGRTGLSGRGVLGRWGPNHAADPVLSRWKRQSSGQCERHAITGLPVLQLLVVERRDCGQWALPGGMIDIGEQPLQAAVRELREEAFDSCQQLPAALQQLLDTGGKQVFSGYVDDPRNTDNSWMETVAISFHDNTGHATGGAFYKEGATVDDNESDCEVVDLPIVAGSDAVNAQWITVSADIQLYASHRHLVELVVAYLRAHW